MTTPPLRVDSINVRYGNRLAVRGASFTLTAGVTGLLGPNGAGKSSLLRTIATAQQPTSGTVLVCGIDVTQLRQVRAARRRIGYLPQAPGFYPGFTVAAFAKHIAVLKEIEGRVHRRDQVQRVLAAVDLENRGKDKVKSLSGGMRQRLALACAMLGDPAVLVLDEPTVGLDPEQRLRFRELIARLGRDRVVLLSTHQTDDVASLCSRVIVMSNGGVLLDDTPRALADIARGSVWEGSEPAQDVLATWMTGEGTYRNIGNPPAGAALLPPAIDDGYLMLMARTDIGAAVEVR